MNDKNAPVVEWHPYGRGAPIIFEEEKMKINLNDRIKVKLTDYGKDIFYRRFDSIVSRKKLETLVPRMPKEDDDGYTTMLLWEFMELYGPHIGMCKPLVIDPIEIIFEEKENEK